MVEGNKKNVEETASQAVVSTEAINIEETKVSVDSVLNSSLCWDSLPEEVKEIISTVGYSDINIGPANIEPDKYIEFITNGLILFIYEIIINALSIPTIESYTGKKYNGDYEKAKSGLKIVLNERILSIVRGINTGLYNFFQVLLISEKGDTLDTDERKYIEYYVGLSVEEVYQPKNQIELVSFFLKLLDKNSELYCTSIPKETLHSCIAYIYLQQYVLIQLLHLKNRHNGLGNTDTDTVVKIFGDLGHIDQLSKSLDIGSILGNLVDSEDDLSDYDKRYLEALEKIRTSNISDIFFKKQQTYINDNSEEFHYEIPEHIKDMIRQLVINGWGFLCEDEYKLVIGYFIDPIHPFEKDRIDTLISLSKSPHASRLSPESILIIIALGIEKYVLYNSVTNSEIDDLQNIYNSLPEEVYELFRVHVLKDLQAETLKFLLKHFHVDRFAKVISGEISLMDVYLVERLKTKIFTIVENYFTASKYSEIFKEILSVPVASIRYHLVESKTSRLDIPMLEKISAFHKSIPALNYQKLIQKYGEIILEATGNNLELYISYANELGKQSYQMQEELFMYFQKNPENTILLLMHLESFNTYMKTYGDWTDFETSVELFLDCDLSSPEGNSETKEGGKKIEKNTFPNELKKLTKVFPKTRSIIENIIASLGDYELGMFIEYITKNHEKIVGRYKNSERALIIQLRGTEKVIGALIHLGVFTTIKKFDKFYDFLIYEGVKTKKIEAIIAILYSEKAEQIKENSYETFVRAIMRTLKYNDILYIREILDEVNKTDSDSGEEGDFSIRDTNDRLPTVSIQVFIRKMKKIGFTETKASSNTKHRRFANNKNIEIMIPKGKGDIDKGIIRQLLEKCEITISEFRDL